MEVVSIPGAGSHDLLDLYRCYQLLQLESGGSKDDWVRQVDVLSPRYRSVPYDRSHGQRPALSDDQPR